MLSCNVCRRKLNPHSLLCQVQPSIVLSPLVMPHVLAGRGGISKRRGVPQAGFKPQCWKTPRTILGRCFHVGEELTFVEAILLRLQRAFTSRWVRKLQKSWLEGISRGHTIYPHPTRHRTIASNRWGQRGPYLAKSWNPGWQSTPPLHTSFLCSTNCLHKKVFPNLWSEPAKPQSMTLAPLAICHKQEEFGCFVPQSLQEVRMGLHANWC